MTYATFIALVSFGDDLLAFTSTFADNFADTFATFVTFVVVVLTTDLLALLEDDRATDTLFWTTLAVTLAALAAFLAGIFL